MGWEYRIDLFPAALHTDVDLGIGNGNAGVVVKGFGEIARIVTLP